MNNALLERYTPEQAHKIQLFLNELAVRTRKSKRISDSRKTNIIAEWESFSTSAVEAAIDIFLKMATTPAQNEKYVKGIMRNIHKEQEALNSGQHKTGNTSDKGSTGKTKCYGDEGERLRKLSQEKNQGRLTCDF